MDKLDKVLKEAERVALLRLQLADAEARLKTLLGAPEVKAVAVQHVHHAKADERVTVSQQVRETLQASNSMAFGELVERVGGSRSAMAARSALKGLREKGLVAFKDGRYKWVGK